MTPTARQIATNIAGLLRLAGITQRDLSAATGIAQSSISQKMHGKTDWSVTDLDRIAQTLNVSVAELVGTIPTAVEWDRRRTPVSSGPRFLVMPEERDDGTGYRSALSRAQVDNAMSLIGTLDGQTASSIRYRS